MGDLAPVPGGETPVVAPRPYPWGDLRLWAAPLLYAGIAAAANLAWSSALPGLAGPTWGVTVAAAVTALGNLGLAMHRRAERWIAEGNVPPMVLPFVAAFVVAPPALGPRLWAYLWTAALLLFVWSKSKDLVRSAVRFTLVLPADGSGGRGEVAPPPPSGTSPQRRIPRRPPVGANFSGLVAKATLDAVLCVGCWVALCDLVAHPAAILVTGPARLAAAAIAAVSALALASWTGRAEVLRRAAGEDAGVQHGFSHLWWWAVAPVIALCVLAGVAVPLYPAPLQHGGVSHLVLGWVDMFTGNSGHVGFTGSAPRVTPGQLRAQNVSELSVGAVCLLALILAWPARRVVEFAASRAAGRLADQPLAEIGWRDRLRLWWGRAADWWGALFGRSRQPSMVPSTRWRPLGGPASSRQRHRPQAYEVRSVAADDMRARVRAAYSNVLDAARAAGMGRQNSFSPRRFLGWLLPRARPAQHPLEGLTSVYEEARFSQHPVDREQAERAEGDAKAAAYGIHLARAEQRRRAGQPASEPALRWTAPRGMRKQEW